MLNIFLKEINGFLHSLIAYVVIGVFLVSIGMLVWVFPESNILDYGYADLSSFFSLVPFVLMFLIPAITMKMFAEETKSGSLEILLVKPVSTGDIVIGKYLAGLSLTTVALLPTLIYYYSVYQLANPVGNVDTAGIIGSYIGLFMLTSVFTAIGVFTSSITDNQVVAFIIAAFISFLLYAGLNSLAGIDLWSSFYALLSQFSLEYHYNAMSRGLLDSRDIIYFISMVIVFLMATKLIVEWRR
jgi:ABC-2 type transport system permease protein